MRGEPQGLFSCCELQQARVASIHSFGHSFGAVAQLVERQHGMLKVLGSNPCSSTNFS